MKYFEGLREEKDIKARYKELAKQHHPDTGGDTEIMKEINSQYETVLRGFYQAEGKSLSEIDEILEKDIVLRSKIDAIISLNGIVVELIGKWIWITGETKQYKEKLKECGFLWSPNKAAWYWRSDTYKSSNRNPKMSLDLIRYRWGSWDIKKGEKRQASFIA